MRMLPPESSFTHVKSNAEIRVAHLISQIGYEEPVACFYSVHLTEHEYKRMSEVDFVVVWEDCVLAIEVKGGRVARAGGSWSFTNRHGEQTFRAEGPFDQARSAMFALKERLEKVDHALDVSFAFLVITPDQALPNDTEWEPWEHAGPMSMTVNGLKKVLDQARSHARKANSRVPRGQEYSRLLQILRPDFDRVPRLSVQAEALEREYIALVEAQYAVLLAAEDNARILCEGGAGTGKTLLAAETARRAAAAGKNVLFVCRSKAVVDYVAALLSETTVRCVAFSQLPTSGPCEVLVVDEAQDVMNELDILLLDSAVEGGIEAGSWRLFCDTNNQAHVDGRFSEATHNEIRSLASRSRLTLNCRNTAPVIIQTQMLTGADLGTPRVGAGPKVVSLAVGNDSIAGAALDARLAMLVEQGVDLEDVAIVSLRPYGEASAAVRSAAYGRKGIVLAAEGRRTGSATLYRPEEIKGLEAPHVCVIDVDDLDAEAALPKLYVAMTRPRVSLWVAYSDRAWKQLRTRGPALAGKGI
ncbi:hypothetical protein E3T33_04765 [Cryobacterium sp. TMT1-2-1]|uniref:NERD domain-containing protein n=1 Tax=Cryobacterium sp. TMT1-2-1 TaxID=1259232 RepID=UPI00106B5C01|nr:nuclease-related domain-containing protein [Cryobacterium sp. TMT1-2-1]TFD46646.1 hypothetical protein E3T33_04765 [Cryobacterium sp. TMT1-2-1]